MKTFSFKLEKSVGKMRAGEITTPHGTIKTPTFMPVGTQASVKSVDSRDLAELGAQIILGNTYHLYLRPGTDILEQSRGLHHFEQWNKPILTDSGGFQVFSLADVKKAGVQTPSSKVTDDGVEFRSHIDGSKHFFTPEKSIQIQRSIGADIIMAFDELLPDQKPKKYAIKSLDRTHRWAKRCKAYWEKHQRLSVQGNYQALFGIVQGGLFEDLRKESAEFMVNLETDGIAVGGETIGYDKAGTQQVMSWIEEILPTNKPRYAMGMGRDPDDIVAAVQAGFDIFDCVGPTRLARNGALYSGSLETTGEVYFSSEFPKGRLPIGNSQFATDTTVIDQRCDCLTCSTGYTRAYLHHLFKTKELSYYRLATIHNLRFLIKLTEELREHILQL